MTDKSQSPGPALPSLAATFAVQTMAAMSMFSVSVVAPVAAMDIGVDATMIGTFTGIAYASGLGIGLLTGALADRFGAIRISQMIMGFALLGCLLLTLSTPVAAFASAIALGLCYGPVNPASTHILARVTPERSRPLYFSIKQTGMPAGAALAGLLLPLIVAAYDWRIAMVATGLATAVVAILIQPLRKPLDAIRRPNQAILFGNFLRPLSLVCQTPMLRRLGLMGFFYSGIQVSIMTFYVVYLTAGLSLSYTEDQVGFGVLGLSLSLPTVGFLYAVLQISAVFGRLFWGAIGDRLVSARYLLVGIGLGTACFSILAGLLSAGSSVYAVAFVSFLLGVTSSGWNGLFFSELVKYAPKDRTGDAAAGLQFATLLGVAVLPAWFGFLVAATGSYFVAFATAGAAVAIGAIQFGWSLRR